MIYSWQHHLLDDPGSSVLLILAVAISMLAVHLMATIWMVSTCQAVVFSLHFMHNGALTFSILAVNFQLLIKINKFGYPFNGDKWGG